jgi:hypothetical protein
MSNLENIFREKTKGLQISPSPNAWNTLKGRINEKSTYRWMAFRPILMAASMIGIIVIGSIILSTSDDGTKTFSYRTSTLNFADADPNMVNRINILNEAYIRLHKGFNF